MRQLIDIITFNEKAYDAVPDLPQLYIEALAERLHTVEGEILACPEASIDLNGSGQITATGVPVDLQQRIGKLVANKVSSIC
jgi:hypothetical protein